MKKHSIFIASFLLALLAAGVLPTLEDMFFKIFDSALLILLMMIV